MAYTSSLRLTLPVTGTLDGTWGDTVNNGITSLTDSAIAGLVNVAQGNVANYTLTSNSGAADEARSMFLNITGALTAARNVVCPTVSKLYVIENSTTGGFAVTLKTTAGTGISVPAGASMVLYCDGTNVVDAITRISSLNLATALGVASGGTGAATLTLNNVVLGNGTSAVQVVAPGTSGNVLTSNGTTWSSTTPTAGVSLSAANTWTATQTFNGSTSTFGTALLDSSEAVNIVAAAPAATTILYAQSGAVQYYTSNAANNFIVNLAFSAGTTMNTALATGKVTTAALITTQGTTAYYGTAVQVDGTAVGVTTRWIGGAPTAGNANGLDTYRFAVIKTAASTYTVLASLTQYKA